MNRYAQEEVELNRKRFGSSIAFAEWEIARFRDRAQWSQELDEARRRMILSVMVQVYGKDHPDRHVVRYPATWWDAVKERFAPAWFRDLYPVRFTVVTASLAELYPDIQPSIPSERVRMRFSTTPRSDYPSW